MPPESVAAARSAAAAPIMPVAGPSSTSTLFDISPQVISIDEEDNERRRCKDSGILIKSITNGNVEFYQVLEFDKDEEGDDYVLVSQGVEEGEYGWIKRKMPLNDFKTKMCDNDDIEVYNDAKETASDKFTPEGAPDEVIEVAKIYNNKMIPSPVEVPVDITPAIITPEVVEITPSMKKGLKAQQVSSKTMEKEFKVLFDKGMTLYPVFIYGQEGDDTIKYLSTEVDPVTKKLVFKEATVGEKRAGLKFKNEVRAIVAEIDKGNYEPSDNIAQELIDLQTTLSPEVRSKVDKVYEEARQNYFTYFGDNHMSDSDEEIMLEPLMAQNPLFDPPTMSPTTSFSKKKKPSEMSVPELEEHMKIKFGPKFARDYKPELYTNSIGVRNVRYVKRDNCDIKDNMSVVSAPLFPEFATQSKGVRFGAGHEMMEGGDGDIPGGQLLDENNDYDDYDDELLDELADDLAGEDVDSRTSTPTFDVCPRCGRTGVELSYYSFRWPKICDVCKQELDDDYNNAEVAATHFHLADDIPVEREEDGTVRKSWLEKVYRRYRGED